MDYVMVTDYEPVHKDDFYLSECWVDECKEDALRNIEAENLYIGYIVSALHYCIYHTMTVEQIFIDNNDKLVMRCETANIHRDKRHVIEWTE